MDVASDRDADHAMPRGPSPDAADQRTSANIIFTKMSVGSRTSAILANLPAIEALPIDGLVVNIPASWDMMLAAQTLRYDDVWQNWLGPLQGAFKRLHSNFLLVVVRGGPDPFDDWTMQIANWETLARAARDSGFVGLMFDNEAYQEKVWNWPDDVKYKTRTLNEYRAQWSRRGRELMEGLVAQWPEIQLITLHGPYISEPRTPARVTLQQVGDASSYELFGPFFAGWLAGTGPKAVVSDGGEVYQYRSADDFQFSYAWRKTDIASEATASAFIPAPLRPRWQSEVDIAFGVYDRTWKPQFPMTPETMKTTLTNALRRADRYVWYYTEGNDWWGDGKTPPAEWVNAMKAARAAAPLP